MASKSSILVRRITTGGTIVFDKAKRELFVVDRGRASSLKAGGVQALAAAKRLAKDGKAQHFNRSSLETLQAALTGVVLLG